MAVFNPYKVGISASKSLGKCVSVQSVVSLMLQFEVMRAAFQKTETGLYGICVIVGLKGALKWAQLK